MNVNALEKTIIGSLKNNRHTLQLFDEVLFCLFNINDLNVEKSRRFKNDITMVDLREMNLVTDDVSEYVDYCKTAHETNSGMMYGCIGILGNTYFIATFKFTVSPSGKLMGGTNMRFDPLFRYSPTWLADDYIKSKGKLKIKDVVLKLKLKKFLDE